MNRQAFAYTTGWIPLAATIGATGPKTLTLAADADFEVKFITGHVIQSNLLIATWAGTVQVNNSAVGVDFFNAAVPFDAIAGNARQPYWMDPAKLLPAQSSLVIVFTNSVATATDVCLVFHGNKLT